MQNLELIKKIREQTGLSVYEIKNAIEEAKGDKVKALALLKERQDDIVKVKSEKKMGAGLVDAYVHSGRVGVLVEVSCQSDFVAKNDLFRQFVHDIALQVASMAPKDVEELQKQPFIKDESMTVGELIKKHIATIGENIAIKRFIRYEQGR
ncbi:MAG: elongation factor Ts [Candidatus Nealsonbacteria bacterium CG23_combo_of_CG06-09_8_20_14_all_40_13]|uniref:Elongation factor Ts n=1 Tax=Candidatus Nealsonbacteria bacterium CG23_combo_of_CG06-09_8_20_14_all_40_13 TaxID=1974724 RepID=A0A2G9YQR9_9BACT|nr:MAG: elongation factor Ts [Candidatus Nealsonbacteria bacterium CG23_combo_of_CG06-09_8_20_14_all_40_13]PIR70757.1 MAG: elongation factor Ts [Candidatus Nealsonbacteria bacterium CG10_big_fil_rev_8_21_14_0_10_40_24]PIU43619.1 MAG: elongation factor Ts [Candidatus Nealsonbacteria bacterium CG07_land_8_20_14_0_80_40_10]